MASGQFADVFVHQSVDLFGVGDDIRLTGDMEEEFFAFAEEFEPDGKFPVEFVQGLLRAGDKKPHLSQFVHFYYRYDGCCYPEQGGVLAKEKGVLQILYFLL